MIADQRSVNALDIAKQFCDKDATKRKLEPAWGRSMGLDAASAAAGDMPPNQAWEVNLGQHGPPVWT